MYYIFIKENKIEGKGQCKQLGEDIINIEVEKKIFDNIEEYVWNGENIVIDPELEQKRLHLARIEKIKENDLKRDIALNEGVSYKGVLFDSDTDQKINLLAIVSTIGEDDTVVWFGKDNEPLACTKDDLINIGGLITALHTFCWTKNAEIKAKIQQVKTIEELNEVVIDYKG